MKERRRELNIKQTFGKGRRTLISLLSPTLTLPLLFPLIIPLLLGLFCLYHSLVSVKLCGDKHCRIEMIC